jgi:hypothetical protein
MWFKKRPFPQPVLRALLLACSRVVDARGPSSRQVRLRRRRAQTATASAELWLPIQPGAEG